MGYGSGLPAFMPKLTWQCDPQIDDLVAQYPEGSVILDMGAGGRRVAAHATTVDFVKCTGTDVVANVCDTPFEDNHADLVIATGLLEHLEDDDAFLAEAFRVLKPGGQLHVEIPFMQQYHDDPIDSRRYTGPGLERLLGQHGFTDFNTGFHIGPGVAIATLNAYYASMLFEGKSLPARIASNAAFFVATILGKPLVWMDRWMKHKKSAHRLAFGVYCTARKAEPEAAKLAAE
jgi:SAM-dependent methyltransferase